MLAFHKPFLDPISTMAPTFLDRSVKHKTIAETGSRFMQYLFQCMTDIMTRRTKSKAPSRPDMLHRVPPSLLRPAF